jgi:ATP-dependent protease HslVU (ClpYQ) peptidase subunit
MTCIVGYSQNKKVWIGADSGGIDVGQQYFRIRKDPKVFINDGIIYGGSGSFRMLQLLQYSFKRKPHRKELSDLEYIHTVLVEDFIKFFETHKIGKIEDNIQYGLGYTFMFGYKGKLYSCDCDFQIAEHFENYDSCGSGYEYALSTIFTLESIKSELNVPEKDWPEYIITKGIESACKFSNTVFPPIVIKSL